MPKTRKFSITVECEVDGDIDRMRTHLTQYLTQEGNGLFDDYGYDTWGGYEGPFVVACTVRDQAGNVIGKHENRTKPEVD